MDISVATASERGSSDGGGRGGCLGRASSRGHGESRGRGRGGECSIGFNPEPSCSTSSAIIPEQSFKEALKKARQSRKRDRAKLSKLTNQQKRLLGKQRELKELQFSLVPDSPKKKKRRQESPPRASCRLMSGVPVKPPARRVQPWEIGTEYIGFTPSSSTTEVPGPSLLTAGSDEEQDLEQLDLLESSDDDKDVNHDAYDGSMFNISLRQRSATEFPNYDEETLGMDAAADAELRKMVLDPRLLDFEWSGDPDTFVGTREEFSGQSGPTFEVRGMSPLDILEKIWDNEIMAKIVQESNRYAHQLIQKNAKRLSRLTRWKDISVDELWTFFAITFMHSLVPNIVEREYWYPILPHLKIGKFADIMSYDRFILIKRCLHFTNNVHLQRGQKLAKILPIVKHLNQKFSSLYLPEQNIALDESLLLWKGKLSFAQMITTKAAQVSIKSYEICESRTGYLWKMDIYAGKNQSHSLDVKRHDIGDDQEAELEGAMAIVLNLTRPLFNKGHTLVMDNFCNSPLLTRLLKVVHRTDTMGTLRLNREFVPDSLKGRTKNNLREGEMCSSCTNDMTVVSWRDSNLVTMISSYHPVTVGGKEKYGKYKYKPQVVLDYNQSMGGVDKKDQMLHAYPIERVRNLIWYKKLFRRLLNVSIHNAYVIFNHHNNKITNRMFRMRLVEDLLKRTPDQRLSRGIPLPSTLHVSVKAPNKKRQRCKLCATNKKRTNTPWTCKTCQVHLCMPCFEEYHN